MRAKSGECLLGAAPHAFVGLAYLFRVGGPGFNQSGSGNLPSAASRSGSSRWRAVSLHLGAVFWRDMAVRRCRRPR